MVGASCNTETEAQQQRDLAVTEAHRFDVVTARSFAAPAVTARWAGELLSTGGVLVVSEPPQPTEERWPVAVLVAAGLIDLGLLSGIRHFRRLGSP